MIIALPVSEVAHKDFCGLYCPKAEGVEPSVRNCSLCRSFPKPGGGKRVGLNPPLSSHSPILTASLYGTPWSEQGLQALPMQALTAGLRTRYPPQPHTQDPDALPPVPGRAESPTSQAGLASTPQHQQPSSFGLPPPPTTCHSRQPARNSDNSNQKHLQRGVFRLPWDITHMHTSTSTYTHADTHTDAHTQTYTQTLTLNIHTYTHPGVMSILTCMQHTLTNTFTDRHAHSHLHTLKPPSVHIHMHLYPLILRIQSPIL